MRRRRRRINLSEKVGYNKKEWKRDRLRSLDSLNSTQSNLVTPSL
jgi:hypothetical protein